jgi:hypothetical protein
MRRLDPDNRRAVGYTGAADARGVAVRPSLALLVALAGLNACDPTFSDKSIDRDSEVEVDSEVTPDDNPFDDDSDEEPVHTGIYLVDADADGLYDHEDNCPEHINPEQDDLDEDDVGDVCDDDLDDDGVPNMADRWPRDPRWPGRVSPESVYPHTATELYRFQVQSGAIELEGAFTFDVGGGNITDIAIDQYGVLYAITSGELFICRPDDAQCRYLADLPGFSIGLTFVQPGVLGPTDVMVGTGAEDWYRLDVVGTQVVATTLGAFDDDGTTSSGDAFSIQGFGTFVSVNLHDDRDVDTLVRVNPATGAIQETLLSFDDGEDHDKVFGLAGWIDGFIYAFDENGDILRVTVQTGTYEVIQETGLAWWGAGVRTVVPPTP